MRIGRSESDAWKVLETRRRASGMESAHERAGEIDDCLDVRAKRATFQSLRRLFTANVDDRREIDFDVEPAQRLSDHPAEPLRQLARRLSFRECFRARQPANEMTQSIDASSLLIDHHQRRTRRNLLHFVDQRASLIGVADVASEEDDRIRGALAQDSTFEI